MSTKKIVLSGMLLSAALLLCACNNPSKEENKEKTKQNSVALVESTIEKFGNKSKDVQKFKADINATNSVDVKGQLSETKQSLNVEVDFKDKEIHLLNKSDDKNKDKDNVPATDMYVKDNKMYLNAYGKWMTSELDPALDVFSEAADIQGLTGVYNEVKGLKKDLKLVEKDKVVTLETKNLKDIELDQVTLESIIGADNSKKDVKVKTYTVKLDLDKNTYLPKTLERNVSVEADGVTYNSKAITKYTDFSDFDIVVPEEALKATDAIAEAQ
ncbi:DUF6612 family protein [Bacillus toyonensis]|uniref:DUF6612 family protein n=1 Tax=Bacillus toyonensis TaxID=155322 RepID=UPI002E2449AA|nr:hypothetical protein [Bacillus toyonensis]